MQRIVKVAANGRVCIPADVRSLHGWEDGQELVLQVRGDEVILSTFDQAIDRARNAVRHLFGKPGASLDDFLADREADEPRSGTGRAA